MSLVVLIPLSLGLGLIGLAAFFWALRNGQFEDPEGAAWRVLSPDAPPGTDAPDDHAATPGTQDRNAQEGS